MFVKIVLFLFFVNVYFVVNLFVGKNCIQSYFRYKKEVEKKQEELKEIIAERHDIEKILMQQHIDKDLLEEIVRKNMHLTSSREVIILQK